jgi:branched-chain amino acid transport system ATP-binding protein
MALLDLVGVSKRFGGLLAVSDVSFSIDDRQIISMIGPNGAGKTTAFNCVTGLFPVSGGDVLLDGVSITGLPPHRITRLGVARTFQNIRLFSYMTAVDNVMVAAHWWMRQRVWDSALTTRRARTEERAVERRALDLLDELGLANYAGSYARELPYGLQRRLEIARALATRPRLLLLDEPAAGLNPQEKKELMALISRLRDEGLTIFLIEHDMKVVMEVSDRIVVLDHGEKITEGVPQEVRNNPQVIEAYLGQGAAEKMAGGA